MALSLAALKSAHSKRSVFIYGVFVFILAIWRYAAHGITSSPSILPNSPQSPSLTPPDVFDPYKCSSLLTTGSWLNPSADPAKPPSNWQPDGCLYHSYNPSEASYCLQNQQVLFAGDSTVRQVFWETVKSVDPTIVESAERHADIRYQKNGIDIQFLWDPYLNSTALNLIESCRTTRHSQPNAYIVLGGGLWFARYLGDNGATMWKSNTDRIVDGVKACAGFYNVPFFLPVSVPDWENLDEARSTTILKPEVTYMNSYLVWLSQQKNIIVPTSLNEMMTLGAYDSSGIHSVDSVAKAKAGLLLNVRCNQIVQEHKGYPYDKTCCYTYPGPTMTQFAILVFSLVIIPAAYIKSSGLLSSPRMWSEGATGSAFVTACFIFATTLTYCYVADRTSLFIKASKQFWAEDFAIMTGLSLLLGVVTLRKSDSEQGFMGRDQSNEWKGWMQIMVLIYHITGASKVLPIYKYIRVMVAAYLFMTGYGHTIYFYKKNDFGLKRVANVLVRLNMLSCALAYSMNTDYLFYYFAPLSSFWFMTVYFTMKVQAEKNKDLKFLSAKIGISVLIMKLFLSVPGIMEVLWWVLSRVFFVSWDLREWRFRVLLDMYIVYIGMFGAIASIKIAELKLLQHPRWPMTRMLVLAGSALALVAYHIMQVHWNSKADYNARHPYISFLPILGFLFLRNATHTLRNTYSTAFAWVGGCSLETFTLQFHIWMAADTRGLLQVVGSKHRTLNLIILTPLFLLVSNLTSEATGKLTSALVNG
ncbi:10 TM acyl transferase domain found in Cas1p-domain-containing protein, partial [Myxozyma melibiosi]